MFINKIKLNYNIKLVDEAFKNFQYDKVKEILQNSSFNKNLYFQLLKYIVEKYFQNLIHQNFFQKKISWIVSFDKNDLDYFDKFFNYYFESNKNNDFKILNYQDFLQSGIESLDQKKLDKKILFEDILNNSNLYQTASWVNFLNCSQILKTSSVFFEASNNKYFLQPHSTLAYIHIIRHPLQIYLNKKNLGYNHQESLNYLNFVDQNMYTNDFSNNKNSQMDYLIPENKQNWNIHTRSWIDENVQSTYRGKSVKYEDLLSNPEEILLEIIFHFKQAGLDLDVNYEIVSNFVKENEPHQDMKLDISRQELKTIVNSLDQDLLNQFKYSI